MNHENDEKTPFIFSETQTSVRLKNGEFRSLQLSKNVSVGWVIGNLEENKLAEHTALPH